MRELDPVQVISSPLESSKGLLGNICSGWYDAQYIEADSLGKRPAQRGGIIIIQDPIFHAQSLSDSKDLMKDYSSKHKCSLL